jgi:hypothetical protein
MTSTAEHAEHAEKKVLGALRDLGGVRECAAKQAPGIPSLEAVQE